MLLALHIQFDDAGKGDASGKMIDRFRGNTDLGPRERHATPTRTRRQRESPVGYVKICYAGLLRYRCMRLMRT